MRLLGCRYNNFIPISLYVTMEMVNYVQAYFIDNDECMYDPESGKRRIMAPAAGPFGTTLMRCHTTPQQTRRPRQGPPT